MRSFIITIIATFVLLIPTGAQDQWEIVNEGFGFDLQNSDFINPDTRWVDGYDGILKTNYTSSSANRFMVVGDVHHYSPSSDFTQTILYELTLAAIEEEVDFIFFPGIWD